MKKPRSQEKKVKISVDRLAPGLFIDLELSWMQHPFLFSHFMIKSQQDIAVIKELGLKEVTLYPERSSTEMPQTAPPTPDKKSEEVPPPQAKDALWQMKQVQMQEAAQYRNHRHKLSQKYRETIKKVQHLTQDLKSAPANAIRDASEIVDGMAAAFEDEGNVLVNLPDASFDQYNHALNVTVLALTLGSAMGIKGEALRHLRVYCMISARSPYPTRSC